MLTGPPARRSCSKIFCAAPENGACLCGCVVEQDGRISPESSFSRLKAPPSLSTEQKNCTLADRTKAHTGISANVSAPTPRTTTAMMAFVSIPPLLGSSSPTSTRATSRSSSLRSSTFTPTLSSRFHCRSRISAISSSSPSRRNSSLPNAKLDALVFDCDGVLAETERDAHRVAFNMAFKEKSLSVDWDEALYGKLLKTGGGKERMKAYWDKVGWPSGFPSHESQSALVQQLHALKTQVFMNLVEQGNVPLRAGVQRLVDEAVQANIPIAVCSTSNEQAVNKIVAMLNVDGIKVFAGDIVPNKKPAPDIYLLALDELKVNPGNTCVIEDSHIGLMAATAAGMPTVITKSIYTKDEDFGKASLVLNSLDDPFTSLDDLSKLVESLGKVPVE